MEGLSDKAHRKERPAPVASYVGGGYTLSMAAFPILSNPYLLTAVAMLLAAPAVFLLFRSRKPWLSHLRRKSLLTANESEFFHRLQLPSSAFMSSRRYRSPRS